MWKTPAFAVCLSSVHSKNIVDLCQIHGLRTDAEKMWSANQAKGMEVTLFFHTVPGALACRRLSDSREVAKKEARDLGKRTCWSLKQAIPRGSAMLNVSPTTALVFSIQQDHYPEWSKQMTQQRLTKILWCFIIWGLGKALVVVK